MSLIWRVRRAHTADQPPLSNVVRSVEYIVASPKTGKMFYSSDVCLKDPKFENFIPFHELTDVDLIQWVKSAIGDIMVEYIEKLAQEDDA